MKNTKSNVWVLGCSHFGHKNIIRYCNRPFINVEAMNRAIINNWNRLVNDSDTVFHLGDVGIGSAERWFSQLKGNIKHIKGNHDLTGSDPVILEHDGIKFYLCHSPDNTPVFDGWVIHAHKHNKNPARWPFIERWGHSCNVCVELIGYEPVNLSEITKIIQRGGL